MKLSNLTILFTFVPLSLFHCRCSIVVISSLCMSFIVVSVHLYCLSTSFYMSFILFVLSMPRLGHRPAHALSTGVSVHRSHCFVSGQSASSSIWLSSIVQSMAVIQSRPILYPISSWLFIRRPSGCSRVVVAASSRIRFRRRCFVSDPYSLSLLCLGSNPCCVCP